MGLGALADYWMVDNGHGAKRGVVEQASSDSHRTIWCKSSDMGEMDDYHRRHYVSHSYRCVECRLQRHMGSQSRPIRSGL